MQQLTCPFRLQTWHFLIHFHSIHWSIGIFQAHLHPADLYIRTALAIVLFSCGSEFSPKTMHYEEEFLCMRILRYALKSAIYNTFLVLKNTKTATYQKLNLWGVRESQTACASMQWEFLQKFTHSLKLWGLSILK